jgi:tRNA_anti-like
MTRCLRFPLGALSCLALLGLVAAGCTSPVPNTSNNPQPGDPTGKTFTLTADELGAELAKDRNVTDNKYRGSAIELSGVVKLAGAGDQGRGTVILECAADPNGLIVSTKDPEVWAKVFPGQKVKLKGNYSEGRLVLYDCDVVDKGENPVPTLAADKFAAEFVADEKAAAAKYRNKPLLIAGEVVGVKKGDGGAPTVQLKGEGNFRVDCVMVPYLGKPEALQAGQQVKVLGRFGVVLPKEAVLLESCKAMQESP